MVSLPNHKSTYPLTAPELDEGAQWRFVKLSALLILADIVVRQAHHDFLFEKRF